MNWKYKRHEEHAIQVRILIKLDNILHEKDFLALSSMNDNYYTSLCNIYLSRFIL